ncbi:hypothetical protein [Streptomyces sp. CBMA123]|uniref:hypothetical protein n=1 Tax=Streptomyces sp. CBMA123 TaxID=1896313 RepID=UPI001661A5E8|nr:hypothetical protein [Streptomyces sp. CBMA123]MBD0688304.1 hypothetical protein [Streptomyces sp. CBMA123]
MTGNPLPPAVAGLGQADLDALLSLSEQLSAFEQAIPVPAPHEPLPEVRDLSWPMVRLHELVAAPLDEVFFRSTSARDAGLGVFTATTSALALAQAGLARAASLLADPVPSPEAQTSAWHALATVRRTVRETSQALADAATVAAVPSQVTSLAARRPTAAPPAGRPPAAGESERRVDAALRRSPALILVSPPAEPFAPAPPSSPPATVVPLRRT